MSSVRVNDILVSRWLEWMFDMITNGSLYSDKLRDLCVGLQSPAITIDVSACSHRFCACANAFAPASRSTHTNTLTVSHKVACGYGVLPGCLAHVNNNNNNTVAPALRSIMRSIMICNRHIG